MFSTAARKDLKRVASQVKDLINKEIFPALSLDPFRGEKLKGINYWKYGLSYHGIQFRVVYEIQNEILLVLIVVIGSRENFYKKLRQRIK